MSIRYYDEDAGRLRIKRHYKVLFWAIAVGLAAAIITAKLHGQF